MTTHDAIISYLKRCKQPKTVRQISAAAPPTPKASSPTMSTARTTGNPSRKWIEFDEKQKRPDPLGEALNSGDGTWRP